jgi:puromycin-sensitive aminopeptidase
VDGEVRSLRLLLSSAEERVALPGRFDWIVANEGGHGFYRVRYAPDLLERLASMPFEVLTAVERFNLVNDMWASILAGISPIHEYLDLTARLKDESDRNVWAALVASFAYLKRIVAPSDQPLLEALTRDRLAPVVSRLGWDPLLGERELVRQLRGEMLQAIGTLGNDAAVQARARELYARYRQEPSAIDPSIVTALLAILARSGGEADYDEFLERFKTAQTPQEEQRYLYSLAGFRQEGLVRQVLRLTLSGEVRTQDAPYLVRSLLMRVDAREEAWRFVKVNWETMERQFPQGGLRHMCEGITALATPMLEADVREFFNSRNISLGGKTLEQYLEQLRIAVSFREREAVGLVNYLSRFAELR